MCGPADGELVGGTTSARADGRKRPSAKSRASQSRAPAARMSAVDVATLATTGAGASSTRRCDRPAWVFVWNTNPGHCPA